MAERISDAMKHVMALADAGKGLFSDCRGMSEHGARRCTIKALRRRGWIDTDFRLTEAGRAALRATEEGA